MLEELIQDAIENEKKIDFGDCSFYVLKDKRGEPHFAVYNENYILIMVKGKYKLIIRDPEGIKINLSEHPKKYKETPKKMDYIMTLKLVGAENIEIPGKFGEIFDYLRKKYPVEISRTKNFSSSFRKVIRVYDEIQMVKDLKKKGLDDRSITEKVYEKFENAGISNYDFRDYKFYTLSNYIQGITYLYEHPELEENLKKWKGKLDDREIARRIYDENNWGGLRFALKFLNENTLSEYIHGIKYLKNHPELEENLKEWKGRLDTRDIARNIYHRRNWVGLEFALIFLGENKIAYQVEKLHKEKTNS